MIRTCELAPHDCVGRSAKRAFGQDEIDWLAQEAGVQPDEFADEVSRELPTAIDKATPQGVIPSVEQAATGAFNRWGGESKGGPDFGAAPRAEPRFDVQVRDARPSMDVANMAVS